MNTVEQLRRWCDGKFVACVAEDYKVSELAFDSRSIQQPVQALFIALKTHVRDGHDFIYDACDKGVRCFLVSSPVDVSKLKNCNVIDVPNTLVALQQICTAHRSQFTLPVIAIAGSNGKTVVKEWLGQLFHGYFNVVRSPKSYNSQTGVPLSVWQIAPEHNLAIFEAGISEPGEMDRLEAIIKPDIGIFTNIGEAHSGGFDGAKQKVREKLILFKNAKRVIYCCDHTEIHEGFLSLKQSRLQQGNRIDGFTWSVRGGADLLIRSIERVGAVTTTIKGLFRGAERSITIPFVDSASVENAINCWCAALILNVPHSYIEERMLALQPVSMRLELRHGANDCTLINDAYNSDITSLLIALNYLQQQKQHEKHTVVLSDLLQAGKGEQELYQSVADMIGNENVQRFIGIGPALTRNKAAFDKYDRINSLFFADTNEFLQQFHTLSFEHEAILLKGARVFAFEKIAKLLEQQIHQTVLNIDLAALRGNLDAYRTAIPAGVRTMAMVKAFAYGSGSFEIAGILQRAGIDYLAVAYTEEGIALRKQGITLPIMVMSPDSASFDRMIAWHLEPELYSFKSLHTFIETATDLAVKDYPVHIKLDTGMHRLGFNEIDVPALAEQLARTPTLKVKTIFSHLVASDDPNKDTFTARQATLFQHMSTILMARLNYPILRHLCNSAAILRLPDLHYDMVRLGLGLYGIDGSGHLAKRLKQIGTLKTTIAQIRDVAAGDSIGYGHRTFAPTNMRIATISIGYADGYMRSINKTGQAYVLIHDQQAPITGSICMDMCMVDVTNIAEATEGDEVIVFGQELPVTLLAQWADTISYEIMSGISQRVKRVYVNE